MDKCTKRTDDLMWGVFMALQSDLGSHTNLPRCHSLSDARSLAYQVPRYSSPYRVKASRQLCDWLKRYQFSEELGIDLDSVTNEKFDADMQRIATHHVIPMRSLLVIQRARRIISRVLGDPPSDEEILTKGQFSRNAVAGFSYDDVYLDCKLCYGSRVSGTAAEWAWFFPLVQSDPLLSGLGLTPQVVDTLHQSNVPKSWKILRPVRPNTLIGSLRSLGLGRVIVERLREPSVLNNGRGINLNYLQGRHNRLALASSRNLRLATADLSAASDSFTPSLVNRLLPRKWYNALKFGRTPYYTREGRHGRVRLYGPSFMAMGIGYTFPVMTLMFWALLRALSEMSGIRGTISVFGDDLIYPSRLHGYVKTLFEDINFVLNSDKTFVIPPFRESCGGDYYDGVEVRPASPEGVSDLLEGDIPVSAYVYKLFNSLIRRWEEVELPTTFAFLRQCCPLTFSVPSHFPDTSGFKDGEWKSNLACETSHCWSTGVLSAKQAENRRIPLIQQPLVKCICTRAGFRPVESQLIYYWEKLTAFHCSDLFHDVDLIMDGTVLVRPSHDVLVWKRVKVGKKGIRKLVAHSNKRESFTLTIGYVYA